MTDTDRKTGFGEAMFEDNEKCYTTMLYEDQVELLIDLLQGKSLEQAERDTLIPILRGLLRTRMVVVSTREK